MFGHKASHINDGLSLPPHYHWMLWNTGATLVIIIDETMPNFIERKHPRKGENFKNKGQGRKSRRQANNPTTAGHKEKREPVRTKPSTSHMKQID